MDTEKQKETTDIVDQKYRGPSVASAAAGEGFIAHYQMGLAGLIVGGGGALIAPKKVIQIEENWSKFHLNNKDAEGLIKWPARITGLSLQGIRSVTKHFEGWLEKYMGGKSERFQAVVFGAGVLGAFGLLVFPLFLAPRGRRKGIEGRKQFETAKAEIISERDQNAALRQKLLAAQTELEDTKTQLKAKNGALTVAPDAPFSATANATDTSAPSTHLRQAETRWADEIAGRKAVPSEWQLN